MQAFKYCIPPSEDICSYKSAQYFMGGVLWLSGSVLDSRLRGCRLKFHRRLVQPRKTHPDMTEKLLTVVWITHCLTTWQPVQGVSDT